MTAAIAALGAVVGYLGAEVAEECVFERLLWPQRFYNNVDISTLLKTGVLLPMGGPLHRAALETLDKFRDHGIYRGRCRGSMLGTALFGEQKGVTYRHLTAEKNEAKTRQKAVRNGFWIQVLRSLDDAAIKRMVRDQKVDEENPTEKARRAVQYVFRLHLDFCQSKDLNASAGVKVSESDITFRTIVGVLCSEITAILFAIGIGLWSRRPGRPRDVPDIWLSGLLCIPIVLKLLAMVFAVHREEMILPTATPTPKASTGDGGGDGDGDDDDDETATPKTAPATATTAPHHALEIFEIDAPKLGFPLITTQGPLCTADLQFFRHYGHPVRAGKADRFREVMCILIVYAHVLNFPGGLIALSWMRPATQYLWLAYQVYTIVAMHVARLGGWQGCGRTEERIARALQEEQIAYLVGKNGAVRATLQIESVAGVAEGRARVRDILEENVRREP